MVAESGGAANQGGGEQELESWSGDGSTGRDVRFIDRDTNNFLCKWVGCILFQFKSLIRLFLYTSTRTTSCRNLSIYSCPPGQLLHGFPHRGCQKVRPPKAPPQTPPKNPKCEAILQSDFFVVVSLFDTRS